MFFFFFFYSGKNEIGMLRFPSGRQPRKRGTRNRVLCGPISPLTSSPPSFSFIIFLLKVHFKSSENCFSLGDNSAHTHTQTERDTLDYIGTDVQQTGAGTKGCTVYKKKWVKEQRESLRNISSYRKRDMCQISLFCRKQLREIQTSCVQCTVRFEKKYGWRGKYKNFRNRILFSASSVHRRLYGRFLVK